MSFGIENQKFAKSVKFLLSPARSKTWHIIIIFLILQRKYF